MSELNKHQSQNPFKTSVIIWPVLLFICLAYAPGVSALQELVDTQQSQNPENVEVVIEELPLCEDMTVEGI